jgi:hypothetical protein
MSLPEPPSSVDNSCAVIWENTLYTYTSEAFQSLKLQEGAEWEELEMGEGVTGATCVGTTPPNPDNAGFFVIGGTGGTTGLQKYTYATGEWTTITPGDAITQNRQGHSSAYIPALDSILVYAGSKDGADIPGQETFTIKLYEPYEVLSHASTAPAAVKPILLPWPPADAFMVGTDAEIYWFKPDTSWRKSGASLAEPVTDTTSVKGALIQGEDNSQNLLLFNLGVSPNEVTRLLIQDANGTPVLDSAPITERDVSDRSWASKRQTQDDWPEYNKTFAPDSIRSNFALAQADDGLVVMVGGGDAQEPLVMFDSLDNTWLNSTDFFFDKDSEATSETSTSVSSTSTSTSTSRSSTSTSISSTTTTLATTSATTTASAEATTSADSSDQDTEDDGLASSTILGITLGSIFAFLLVLALALWLLRRRKLNQEKAAAGRDDRMTPSEKGPRTLNPNAGIQIPSSPGHFRGHRPQASQDSFSSMAILMGKVNQQKAGAGRKESSDVARKSSSSFHKQFKSNISKPIPRDDSYPILQGRDDDGNAFNPTVAAPRRPTDGQPGQPDPQDGTRRSSGWNKYWSGGSALQVLGFGNKRATMASEQSSHYSQSSVHNPRATQDSATVPPLQFEGRANVNRVNSGSPVVTGFPSKIPFGEGVAGKIERPVSRASSGYSSGIPESVNEAWDPTDSGSVSAWGTNRAPSSAYASSFAFGSAPPANAHTSRAPPSGVSTQPQLAMAAQSSDMSWLNLGEQSRR